MINPVNSDKSLEEVISLLRQTYAEFGYFELEVNVRGKKRTKPQQNSLELYCKYMAKKLNDGGYDYSHWVEYALKRGLEVPFTQELFKDIFREYAAALYPEIVGKDGKATTSKLTKEKMPKAYELVNFRMSTIFGVGMPWPSKDE